MGNCQYRVGSQILAHNHLQLVFKPIIIITDPNLLGCRFLNLWFLFAGFYCVLEAIETSLF